LNQKIFMDKVIIVTGGASGIGAAICRRFGQSGARIAVLDLDRPGIESFVKKLTAEGIEAIGLRCDVSDRNECEAAIARAIAHFGGVDILVNNAGITQRGPFSDTEISVYRRVMDVNFFGALYCTKAAVKNLISRKGMIIVTSSHAGYSPLIGRTGYSASKHALHGLFESLRSELKGCGVHVMMVCPGFTSTNLQKRALGANGSVNTKPRSMLGKEDTPERVADAVYRGAAKGKNIIVLTPIGKLTYFMHRMAPGVYERLMAKKLRSEIEG
jgi:NAD(P)-dependent dehydrogenase (short-subunit alcohol dehydrogenase family)